MLKNHEQAARRGVNERIAWHDDSPLASSRGARNRTSAGDLAPRSWAAGLAPWLALPRGSSDSIERRFHAVEQLAAASGPTVRVRTSRWRSDSWRSPAARRSSASESEIRLGESREPLPHARARRSACSPIAGHARGGGLPAGEGHVPDAYYLYGPSFLCGDRSRPDFERLDATLQLGVSSEAEVSSQTWSLRLQYRSAGREVGEAAGRRPRSTQSLPAQA